MSAVLFAIFNRDFLLSLLMRRHLCDKLHGGRLQLLFGTLQLAHDSQKR